MKLQYLLKIAIYLGLLIVSFILATKLFYGLESTTQLLGTSLIILMIIIIRFLLRKLRNISIRLGVFYFLIVAALFAFNPYYVRTDTIDTHPLLKETAYFPHDVGLYIEDHDYNDLFKTKINDNETEIIFLTSSTTIELFDIVGEEFYVFDLYGSGNIIQKNETILTYHFFEENVLLSVTKGDIFELVLINIKSKEMLNRLEISDKVIELIGNEIYMTTSDKGYKYTINSDLVMIQTQEFNEEISFVASIEDGFLITLKYGNGYSDTLIYSDTIVDTNGDEFPIVSTAVKHYVKVLEEKTIVVNDSTPSYMELSFLEFIDLNSLEIMTASYNLDYVGSNNIVVQSDYLVQTDGKYYYISMGWPMYKDMIFIKDETSKMIYYDDVIFYQKGEGIKYNMGLVVTGENIYFLSHDGMYYLEHTEIVTSYSYMFSRSLVYLALFTLPLFTLGKAKVRDNSTDFRYNRSNYDTYKTVNKNKVKKREKW